VRITMVPSLVDLESATRESVMDRNSWVYRRMADELQEEGKTAVYGDVREYLYVDAKLTLSDGAVAAIARGTDGTWRSSDRARTVGSGRSAFQPDPRRPAGQRGRRPHNQPDDGCPHCRVGSATLQRSWQPGPNGTVLQRGPRRAPWDARPAAQFQFSPASALATGCKVSAL